MNAEKKNKDLRIALLLLIPDIRKTIFTTHTTSNQQHRNIALLRSRTCNVSPNVSPANYTEVSHEAATASDGRRAAYENTTSNVSILRSLPCHPDGTALTSNHSAATNAKNSPLCRLPPELRVQIYQYVLGGLNVEVSPHFPRKRHRPEINFCPNPSACPHALPSSPAALRRCEKSLYQTAWQLKSPDRHSKCQSSSDAIPNPKPARLNLSILQVCRLFHLEASLLPFQKNTFTIHVHDLFARSTPTLQQFLGLLSREQREALTHLTVTSPYCVLENSKGQIARLKGLKSLHIVQMPDRGLDHMYEALGSLWENLRARPREWRCLELEHLKTVRLSMDARFSRDRDDRETEEGLLSEWSPALTRVLGVLERRLFVALARRPMRVAGEGGEGEGGDRFEGRLSEAPFLK